MKPFTYGDDGVFLAGGTTLLDLMKLGVAQPQTVVDLAGQPTGITLDEKGLCVQAGTTMTQLAEYPGVAERFPAVSQALLQAASPQIRNMATIGGNLLQRTRCSYFRDTASKCNKRMPGAGCDAIGGHERGLAILGRGTGCIANYAGDLAIALVALGATLTCRTADGKERTLAVADLHTLPGDRPDIEHRLAPGERILSVTIPDYNWTFSTYVKLRERASYAFALSSAALCLRLDDAGYITEASLALGGMVSKPWLSRIASTILIGRKLTNDLVDDVVQQAYADAEGDPKLIAVAKATVRGAFEKARIHNTKVS